MNNREQNGAFGCFALLLATGAVIAAFHDSLASMGWWVLLLAFPIAVLITFVGDINRKVLIPAFVMKERYISYFILLFFLCLIPPLAGMLIEFWVRNYYHFPHRVDNYLSPWILVDSLSTCVLLMVIMFGLSVVAMFLRWRRETRHERKAESVLTQRLIRLRERVHPQLLLRSLDSVIDLISVNKEEAETALRKLSDNLRRQLYSDSAAKDDTPVTIPCRESSSRFEQFLVSHRYRPYRWLVGEFILIMISLSAIFDAPDQPNLSFDGFMAFIGMLAVLNALILGHNALSRWFIRKGQLISFLIGTAFFLLGIWILTIVVQFVSYDESLFQKGFSPVIPILSSLASLATLGLLLAGSSALIALRQWVKEKRIVASFRSRTARVELSILQGQINPHFLFNVLNNVGVLIYEAPTEAKAMMLQLRGLLEYQLKDADREYTTIDADANFIKSYLLLEKSRKDPFDFKMDLDPTILHLKIPTLLFIPFVENAAKHSNVVDGHRDIEISISRTEQNIKFVCRNSFDPRKNVKRSCGGLGIENTTRRLMLLFDDKFALRQLIQNNKFEITLIFPIK